MAEWEAKYPVQITPTADRVVVGFQKLKDEVPIIYSLLNRLRRLDAGAGQDVTDAEANQLRIDTTINRLLIRDTKNETWIDLGAIAPNFGITAESIGAVVQKSNTGSFYFGDDSARPEPDDPDIELQSNDLFLSMNGKRIDRWTGSAWETWLSLNFGDMLNYERYTIPRSEVATSGKGKVLRIDPNTGKGDIDITGSPERLLDKLIDVEDLHDGDALVYNAEKDKIVNLPNGEKIGGRIPVALRDIADGQALLYDAETIRFIPAYLQAVTHDALVEASGWEELPTPSGVYHYYYDIPANDVNSDTFVQVIVDDEGQDAALLAALSPKCLTRDGFIRLHAVAAPTIDINVVYAIQPSRAVS